MMMNFNFDNPTNLYFGAGALNELGNLAMPGKKALVLTSNGKSTKENGYLDRTLTQLDKAGVQTVVFDKIGGEFPPPRDNRCLVLPLSA